METVLENKINFPTREQHNKAWEELAQAIALNADKIIENSINSTQYQGRLTIIGSGIETLGFTLGDEDLIRSAHAVFYCVADPATVVWIKELRPDAYDLYVLYDDTKVRYTTYMQMTEAILHYVRQGKHVVAIYYGHPGIFVLSTHRAILIARREGHKAVMRPGICALDCLCADLSIDPCHPGMQTHEATDMLIRNRIPDTSLHVVLWQVGLIGEMGFRRKGYINQNFSIFIEYLQKYYGEDYPITHYVASRYPSIPATIEIYQLSQLHDLQIQTRVTGVSTFYLAPQKNTDADKAMLLRLGLLKPGQEIRNTDGPLREIGKYDLREKKAFRDFKKFKVPKEYQWQENTPVSQFIISLRKDVTLQQKYSESPKEALSEKYFPNLTDRERNLLSTRNPGAIQIAAKGVGIVSQANQSFLKKLFSQKPLQIELLNLLQSLNGELGTKPLAQWSKNKNIAIDWDRLRSDINLTARNLLFPWNGIYQSKEEEILLILKGDLEKFQLIWNGVPIRNFSYNKGVLQWKKGSGNLQNGFFRTDVDLYGRRRFLGSLWQEEKMEATKKQLVIQEVSPKHSQFENGNTNLLIQTNGVISDLFYGTYFIKIIKTKMQFELKITKDIFQISGENLTDVKISGNQLFWKNSATIYESGSVTLLKDPITLYPVAFGSVTLNSGITFKCVGMVLPPKDFQREGAEFGLTHLSWGKLLKYVVATSAYGGGLTWYQWEKSFLAALLVNKTLTRILP